MNYSYVTLLTNDSYVNGVILLLQTLIQTQSKYPLTVLYTNDVSPPTLEILRQLNINLILVENIPLPENIAKHNQKINPRISGVWRNCWTKFHIFNLTQFNKIVFLDADILILKNLDHLFTHPHMTSCLDGEYINLWPEWPHFNTGCLVIEPSTELFNNILSFGRTLKDLPKYVLADQEILNLYFKDWIKKPNLHLNEYYDIFAPYINKEDLPDVKRNCYFIHYTGRKPWENYIKDPMENYSEYFYELGKNIIDARLANLNFLKVHEKVKVAVYAICKDEFSNIQKWIDCFSEADYLCILDTGSTDGTWEYIQKEAKKRNNLFIAQKKIIPWRYDTARNESLKLVPKDTTMFFMVDLDELIINDPDWAIKIKCAWTPSFSRAKYIYHREINPDGGIQKTIQEYRIHSKEWNKYVHMVHETLENIKGDLHFAETDTTPIDIAVYHYGNTKSKNYAKLCEDELKEHPDDAVMRLQLAIEYELLQEYEKAK